jgi:3-(methylthio)propionyl---CoA ligase
MSDDPEVTPTPGLMQPWPLTVDKLIEHAARWHARREVVSRDAHGVVHRIGYGAIHERAKRLSHALISAGIRPGDRVGTLGCNSAEHLVAWYGIMGFGAVCHTLNTRLSDDQLVYIVNHAGDRLIMADAVFAPALKRVLPRCPAVTSIVLLDEPRDGYPDLETFLDGHPADANWGDFDERSAAGLCYTSGTTGDPKGVLYSHRSNYLHTLTSIGPDVFNLSATEVILPVVPMFHANGWGLPFSAPLVGAKLVLPGSRVDGGSLLDLIEMEGVSLAVGVATVWHGLLTVMRERDAVPSTLRRIIMGGMACPESLARGFEELGIAVHAAWGMTELSPVGVVAAMTSAALDLPDLERHRVRRKPGRAAGVDLRIVDAEGRPLAHDGRAQGALQVRGPAVLRRYFGMDRDALTPDGWLDTGDIATIDEHGYMELTDRAKDVIKSGGEWISSSQLEAAASAHPAVAMAAAIGVPHPKWGERPLLLVQLAGGETLGAKELQAFLAERVVKWWIPDDIVFVESMPLGATGKIDKRALRKTVSEGGGRAPAS